MLLRRAAAVCGIVLACVSAGRAQGTVIAGGGAVGRGYYAVRLSGTRLIAPLLTPVLEGAFYYVEQDGIVNRGYYGAVLLRNTLARREGFSLDSLAGIVFSQSDFTLFSTQLSITPGLGLSTGFRLSPLWDMEIRALAVIYSDGAALPWRAAAVRRLGAAEVLLGVDGVFPLLFPDDGARADAFGLFAALRFIV